MDSTENNLRGVTFDDKLQNEKVQDATQDCLSSESNETFSKKIKMKRKSTNIENKSLQNLDEDLLRRRIRELEYELQTIGIRIQETNDFDQAINIKRSSDIEDALVKMNTEIFQITKMLKNCVITESDRKHNIVDYNEALTRCEIEKKLYENLVEIRSCLVYAENSFTDGELTVAFDILDNVEMLIDSLEEETPDLDYIGLFRTTAKNLHNEIANSLDIKWHSMINWFSDEKMDGEQNSTSQFKYLKVVIDSDLEFFKNTIELLHRANRLSEVMSVFVDMFHTNLVLPMCKRTHTSLIVTEIDVQSYRLKKVSVPSPMADCIGQVMILLKSLAFMYIEYTDSSRLYNMFGEQYARRLFDTLCDHLIPGATPSEDVDGRRGRNRIGSSSASAAALASPLTPNDRAAYADIQKAVATFEYEVETLGFFKQHAPTTTNGQGDDDDAKTAEQPSSQQDEKQQNGEASFIDSDVSFDVSNRDQPQTMNNSSRKKSKVKKLPPVVALTRRCRDLEKLLDSIAEGKYLRKAMHNINKGFLSTIIVNNDSPIGIPDKPLDAMKTVTNKSSSAFSKLDNDTLLLPEITVSKSVVDILQLTYQIMDLAVKYKDNGGKSLRMFMCSRKIIEAFIIMVPTLLSSKDYRGITMAYALTHNSFMYLAHFCMMLTQHYSGHLPEIANTTVATFAIYAPQLHQLAAKTLSTFTDARCEEITDMIQSKNDILVDLTTDKRFHCTKKLLDNIDSMICKLGQHWSILPSAVFIRSIGSLSDAYCSAIVKYILEQEDFNSDDVPLILHFIEYNVLNTASKVFANEDIFQNYQNFSSPYKKLKNIYTVFKSSLEHIRDNWKCRNLDKDIITKTELKGLIRAIFQNTEMRASVLNSI